MGEIKSALEIALARVEGVESDREGAREREIEERGKRLVSAALSDPDEHSRLTEALSSASSKEKRLLVQGGLSVLATNMRIAGMSQDGRELPSLKRCYALLTGNNSSVETAFEQLGPFLERYNQDKRQIADSVKAQILPRLNSQMRELAAKTGMEVHVDPEASPEFGRMLSEGVSHLNSNYQPTLDDLVRFLEGLAV